MENQPKLCPPTHGYFNLHNLTQNQPIGQKTNQSGDTDESFMVSLISLAVQCSNQVFLSIPQLFQYVVTPAGRQF